MSTDGIKYFRIVIFSKNNLKPLFGFHKKYKIFWNVLSLGHVHCAYAI